MIRWYALWKQKRHQQEEKSRIGQQENEKRKRPFLLCREHKRKPPKCNGPDQNNYGPQQLRPGNRHVTPNVDDTCDVSQKRRYGQPDNNGYKYGQILENHACIMRYIASNSIDVGALNGRYWL